MTAKKVSLKGDDASDVFFTRSEFMDSAIRAGLTKKEAKDLFSQIDQDGNGILDLNEIAAAIGQDKVPKKVPVGKATWYEAVYTLVILGGQDSGIWQLKEGRTPQVVWDNFFSYYAPAHRMHYSANLVRALVTSLLLNGLNKWPVIQLGTVLAVETPFMLYCLTHIPCMNMALARLEIVCIFCRWIGFSIMLLGALGAMDVETAATIAMYTGIFVLVQTVVTQLSPLIIKAERKAHRFMVDKGIPAMKNCARRTYELIRWAGFKVVVGITLAVAALVACVVFLKRKIRDTRQAIKEGAEKRKKAAGERRLARQAAINLQKSMDAQKAKREQAELERLAALVEAATEPDKKSKLQQAYLDYKAKVAENAGKRAKKAAEREARNFADKLADKVRVVRKERTIFN